MRPDGAALARRGLTRGATTHHFSLAELAAAIDDPPKHNVYVEPEGTGLSARGGAARLAVRARLAPTAPQQSLLLELLPATGELRLRLRLAADVPPLHELLLWPDATALALLHVPHLTPLNITGSKSYTCHLCGTEFEHPNPLKVHLLLGCREHTTLDFWRHCLSSLRRQPPPEPRTAAWGSPAQLEALAAAWGRSRDGHVCVYCGKLYSRKYGLKIHIRTHTGYKPLRCRHCLRAFGDPSNLNKHVRLHAAAAAHACGLCGVALVRRRDLERHVRARHPPPPQ